MYERFFFHCGYYFCQKKNILLAGVARKIYQLWKITGKINNSTGTERNYSEIAQQKWDTYIFGWFFGLFFFFRSVMFIYTQATCYAIKWRRRWNKCWTYLFICQINAEKKMLLTNQPKHQRKKRHKHTYNETMKQIVIFSFYFAVRTPNAFKNACTFDDASHPKMNFFCDLLIKDKWQLRRRFAHKN